MPKPALLCALMVASAAIAPTAAKSAETLFSETGEWKIYHDTNYYAPCFARMKTFDGTVVETGFIYINSTTMGWLLIGHPSWKIDEFSEEEDRFHFGDAYEVTARRAEMKNPKKGLFAMLPANKLIAGALLQDVSITDREQSIAIIDLGEAQEAFSGVLDCSKEHDPNFKGR